jgi:penicillin-binding protein 1A
LVPLGQFVAGTDRWRPKNIRSRIGTNLLGIRVASAAIGQAFVVTVRPTGKPSRPARKPTRPAAKGRPPAKSRRTAPRRPSPPPRRRWRAVLVGLAVFGGLLLVPPIRSAVAMAASKVVLTLSWPLAPRVAQLDRFPEPSTVRAADGSVLAVLADTEARLPVHLDDLPPHVRQAVLAAEDARFYTHRGVDTKAVLRAFVRTLGGELQGGSTITQQLAKLNYTAGERTVLRKLREALYASKLERRYSKDQLLERYVNQVYFGEGAYGIQAAAREFFEIDAQRLSPAQAALLAGKIRAPGALDPRRHPDRVLRRRDQVLDRMSELGWLSGRALESARREPLSLAPPKGHGLSRAPHFVEFVKREASRLNALGPDPETRISQLFTGGYQLETTLDPKIFEATVAAVSDRLGEIGDPLTATASVEPGTGAIRSLFGGLDFATTQFDPSSRGGRQPGSAFKPFVYLAALAKGIDPRTTFDGASGRRIGCYGDRPVANYAGEDAGGRVDVDTALAHSVNVVFVDLGCRVGVHAVIAAARQAGIPENATKAQGALFLGGLDRGVSPLTMATAYATFAAGGVYAEPYAIRSIRDPGGEIVHVHRRSTRQAFSPEVVGVLNQALQRVVSEGTGRAAAIGRPMAGKTGTTQDNGDAWFVGYVPQVATAVWVGYEPRRPMLDVHGRTVTGGSFPAAIFADLMGSGLQGVPVRPIPTSSLSDLGITVAGGDPGAATTTSSSSTIPPPESTSTSTTTVSTTTTTSTTRPPRTTTTTAGSTTTTTTTKGDQGG